MELFLLEMPCISKDVTLLLFSYLRSRFTCEKQLPDTGLHDQCVNAELCSRCHMNYSLYVMQLTRLRFTQDASHGAVVAATMLERSTI